MTQIKENWLNGPISKFFCYNQAQGIVAIIYTQIHMRPGRNLNHEIRYQLSCRQFTWFNPISSC